MNFGLNNKIAIVTAASQGLGKASALALAQEGTTIVICSRRQKEIFETAKEIHEATGATIVPMVVNVMKLEDIKQLVLETKQQFGTIHILVNNAGGPPTGTISSLTDEDWRKGHELTLMSMVRLTREILPMMVQQKWGRIITITSIAAIQPINELLLSSAIRPGILGLTKVLANLHAKDNITINTVCPGNILTKRQEELSASRAKQKNMTMEEYLKETASAIPAGRLGRPEEIGNTVAFLASEQASYINGVNLLVDGSAAKGIH
jgi:3-oxoacyl-[acyl-carrier protein] reductase